MQCAVETSAKKYLEKIVLGTMTCSQGRRFISNKSINSIFMAAAMTDTTAKKSRSIIKSANNYINCTEAWSSENFMHC